MEFWRRKKEKGKARKWFLRNGSMFLAQLIADSNGMSNPIRMFSSFQISKASNHFDPKYSLPDIPSPLRWYKGVIEGRSYLIKRFTRQVGGEEESASNDIVLSARVSNHIGFLQLIGSCLEFPLPVLVLLMGRPATFASSSGGFCTILDYVKHLRARGEPVEFRGNSNDMRPGQMKMFLELALRCCEERNEDRPKMILVAKEDVFYTKLIEKSLDC